MEKTKRTSDIKFSVHLDEENLPIAIDWSATDAGMGDKKKCRALLISLFDETEKSTLKIDLWTKEMLIDDMKRFFAETFMSLGDTYLNATSDQELANTIKAFAKEFATKAEIVQGGN